VVVEVVGALGLLGSEDAGDEAGGDSLGALAGAQRIGDFPAADGDAAREEAAELEQ